MKNWTSPIRILLLYLVGMAVVATIQWSKTDLSLYLTLGFHLALLFGSMWGSYQLLNKVHKVRPTRWEHRLISTLILFLLFDSLIPWWIFIVLGIVTELGQRFLRFPTGPIFNPAGLAIIVTGVATRFLPTWWATNFGPRFGGMLTLACLVTLPVAGYVAFKYKKLWSVGSAIVGVIIASLLLLQNFPAFLLLDGTAFFFLLVMAVEPKTSPVIKWQQIAYGGFIGVMAIVGIKFYFLESFVIPMLIANGVFNFYRNRKIIGKKPAPPTPQPAPVTQPVAPAQPTPTVQSNPTPTATV